MATNQPAPVYVTDAYEPMGARARAASALLWLCVALATVAVVSDVMEYSLLGRLERGEFTSRLEAIEDAEASDERQASIAIGQVALAAVTGIVFIAWFYGMYKNLKAMGRYMKYGTGWAIGGWFVPVLSFWRPKEIANEIYRESDPSAPANDLNWVSDKVPQVVHWWWGTWIASLILWRVADAFVDSSSSIDELKTSSLMTLAGDVASVAAAILAVIVVRRLTGRQEEWARNHLGRQAISSST